MPQWEENVGQVSQSPLTGKRYQWVIKDFFTLPQRSDSRIVSPQFEFENQMCCLGVWPCVDDIFGLGWIGLTLWIHPRMYPLAIDFDVKLGILEQSGTEYKSCSVECVDEFAEKQLFSCEVPHFLSRSQFMDDINTIVPHGEMTVFCEVRTKEHIHHTYSFEGPEFWAA